MKKEYDVAQRRMIIICDSDPFLWPDFILKGSIGIALLTSQDFEFESRNLRLLAILKTINHFIELLKTNGQNESFG